MGAIFVVQFNASALLPFCVLKPDTPYFSGVRMRIAMTRHDETGRHDTGRQGVILVADDHELIRRSMAEVLHAEFTGSRVVTAGHMNEALELYADPEVFLAIVDLTMPGMTSPRDLLKLRLSRPDVRVVVLSGSESRSDILAALEAGVHGYIVKSEPTDVVLARIRHVLSGEIYVPPSIADVTAETLPAVVAPADSLQLDVLTPRQREVLQLITEGLSNKEIGRQLKVAEGTVKMHVATILKAIVQQSRARGGYRPAVPDCSGLTSTAAV